MTLENLERSPSNSSTSGGSSIPNVWQSFSTSLLFVFSPSRLFFLHISCSWAFVLEYSSWFLQLVSPTQWRIPCISLMAWSFLLAITAPPPLLNTNKAVPDLCDRLPKDTGVPSWTCWAAWMEGRDVRPMDPPEEVFVAHGSCNAVPHHSGTTWYNQAVIAAKLWCLINN